MPPWLVFRWRESTPPHRPLVRAIDLAESVMPCVQAHGLSGAAPHQALLCDRRPAGAIVTRGAPLTVGVEKPPYRVPPLSSLSTPPGSPTCVSTFAAGGGSSTGYRMAGFRVLAAVEFLPAAAATYRLNCARYTKVVERDVRDLEADELLQIAGIAQGELDLFDGSPPCEPFSSAGLRDKKWGQVVEYSGKRQRTDDLFFEFARLVDGVRPRVFVAENVEGLVRGRAKGYFLWIVRRLRGLGYRVQARVLDAQWLGVPQVRKRVIFVGVREDLGLDPAFPDPLPYNYSTRDAIEDLVQANGERLAGLTIERRMGARAFKTDPDQPASTVVSKGGTQGDTTNGTFIEYDQQIVGNEAFEPVFGSLDEPSPTVLAGGPRTSGEIRGPRVRRKLTIPELARICGFPDDYRFHGSFGQQWERLGDAVPPPMAAAIGQAVRQEVLDRA